MRTFKRQTVKKITHQMLFGTFIVLLVMAGLSIGQTKSSKTCKHPKKKTKSVIRTRTKQSKPSPISFNTNSNFNRNRNFNFVSSFGKGKAIEKSIKVSSKSIYIQVCVLEGKVKINGWNRSEVRAFVDGGEQLGIRVREKSRKDNKPVWIQILGYDLKKRYGSTNRGQRRYSKCLSGETIELDVPKYADVKIEGRSSATSVDAVKTAKVNVVDGDINVNNVKYKTDAHTHQGSITVRNSGGRMSLSTTTGNIIAYNTDSNEIGDYFKAKSRSGAVTLQSIGQKEVEASSVSGTLNYVGRIRSFGQYGFTTTNGLINMIIPARSSFRLTATYGGAFQSELPLTDVSKNRTQSVAYLTGRVGSGEANVNLQSFNGTIRIKRQNVRLAKLFR